MNELLLESENICMSSIITAQFDSIDMATLAAKAVATRIPEIDSINVISKRVGKKNDSDHDLLMLATPYSASDYTNGMMTTSTQPYLANAAVLTELAEHSRHADLPTSSKIRVEVKTTGGDVCVINSTLRSFGGRVNS